MNRGRGRTPLLILFLIPWALLRPPSRCAEALSGAAAPLDRLAKDDLRNTRRMAEFVREGLARK